VIDEVYICLPVRSYYETITSMAYLCEGIGTPVRLASEMDAPGEATERLVNLIRAAGGRSLEPFTASRRRIRSIGFLHGELN